MRLLLIHTKWICIFRFVVLFILLHSVITCRALRDLDEEDGNETIEGDN